MSVWNWKTQKQITEQKGSADPVGVIEWHPKRMDSIVMCGKSSVIFWTFAEDKLTKKSGIFEVRRSRIFGKMNQSNGNLDLIKFVSRNMRNPSLSLALGSWKMEVCSLATPMEISSFGILVSIIASSGFHPSNINPKIFKFWRFSESKGINIAFGAVCFVFFITNGSFTKLGIFDE